MPLSAFKFGGEVSDVRTLIKSVGLPTVAAVSIVAGAAATLIIFALTSALDVALFMGLMASLIPVAYARRAVAVYDSEVEAKAPEFFYDLSEQVKASGSIVKALKRVSRHEYGIISDEVCRMLSEIEEEGMDIASSLRAMASRANNRYIDRSVSVIREALTTSSNLESILKVVASEGRLSLSLKKERQSGISSSIFVIYFTAIIFLAVTMLCLTSFMHLSSEMRLASGVEALVTRDAVMPYYVLSVSVALCTGLTIGEMRDASVYGGAGDAAILLLLTFLAYELVIFPGYNLLGAYGL
jgi:archaeal flagellar protein FlaJ